MKLSILPIAILSTTLFTFPSQAQEHPGCFWVNPSGQFVSLAALCGNAPVSSAPQVLPQVGEDLRAIAYADAFCRARRDGYPGDVARDRASRAMVDQGVVQHGGDAAAALAAPITDAVLNDALDKVHVLCPEFE